jgi:arsenite methyltransferase
LNSSSHVLPPNDIWADWLLHRRFADDPAYAERVRLVVQGYIDRVLNHAQISPNAQILDVGAGEGTLGFRAIERFGSGLHVTMSDISSAMLSHASQQAEEQGVSEQCSFVETSADSLSDIPEASVDVVTSRSVLAYVADKRAAFRAMYRVLKPGGCVSIAEPIFQDEAFDTVLLKNRVEAQAPDVRDLGLTLLHRWKSAQFPDTPEKIVQSPIANYSERDLMRWAVGEGFAEIHLELHVDVKPSIIQSWEVFLGASPHPWAPSLKTIMDEQFTAQERAHFEAMVRPSIEAGHPVSIDRMAYLSARKPL